MNKLSGGDNLIEKLEEIFAEMRKQRERIRELEAKDSEIIETMRYMEAIAIKDINSVMDRDGRPKYSNQQLRNAELRIRLHDNEPYNALKEDLRSVRNEMYRIATEYNILVEKKGLLLGKDVSGEQLII